MNPSEQQTDLTNEQDQANDQLDAIPQTKFNFKKVWITNKWSYDLCRKISRKTVPILIVSQIIEQLQSIISISIYGYLITSLTHAATAIARSDTANFTLSSLYKPFILFSLFNVFSTYSKYFSTDYLTKTKFKIEVELKSRFIKKLFEVNPTTIKSVFNEDDVNSLFSQAPKIYAQFILTVNIITGVVTALVSALILAYFSPLLPLLILPLAIPHFLLEKKYRRANTKQIESSNKLMKLVRTANSTLLNTNKLALLPASSSDLIVDKAYTSIMFDYNQKSNAVRSKWVRSQKFLTAISSVATIAAYSVVLLKETALLNAGSIYVQLRLVSLLRDKINSVISGIFASESSTVLISDFRNFFERNENVESLGDRLLDHTADVDVQLDNLSYITPTEVPEPILTHASARFSAGTNNAIVSTDTRVFNALVGLLCMQSKPADGRILINGADLHSFNKDSWFSNFTCIYSPESYLNFLSVKDNFAIGTSGPFNMELAREVARLTGTEDFIEKLPLGWDTKLATMPGETYPKADKIALLLLLKSIYQRNKLIVFSLPAFKLPREVETKCISLLFSLKGTSTIIVFSSMITTSTEADCIIHVEKDTINDSGTYAELMEKNGHYAQLYNSTVNRLKKDTITTVTQKHNPIL